MTRTFKEMLSLHSATKHSACCLCLCVVFSTIPGKIGLRDWSNWSEMSKKSRKQLPNLPILLMSPSTLVIAAVGQVQLLDVVLGQLKGNLGSSSFAKDVAEYIPPPLYIIKFNFHPLLVGF